MLKNPLRLKKYKFINWKVLNVDRTRLELLIILRFKVVLSRISMKRDLKILARVVS